MIVHREQKHTPIEWYELSDRFMICVKREDLCFAEPAPPFSKLRGLMEYLSQIKHNNETAEKPIQHIAYVESPVSMAGWGVAWACETLGFNSIIFNPTYKPETTNYLLKIHRQKWAQFNSCRVIDIKAARQKVNWFWARKLLKDLVPKEEGYILLPLGLPFQETINQVAKEAEYALKAEPSINTIVLSIGSGTMAAGVLRGISNIQRLDPERKRIKLIGVVCREYSELGLKQKAQYIRERAFNADPRDYDLALLNPFLTDLLLVDPGWEYLQKPVTVAPFPCHPYYDLKAWEYLLENYESLSREILFWNIGQEAKPEVA